MIRRDSAAPAPVLVRTFYREYRLLFQNRTALLLGVLPPLVYVLCFVTSMSRTVTDVPYKGAAVPYAVYVLPAVVVMSMVAGATQSATLLFGEEMSGMLAEVFSAPVSRAGFIAGRLVCTSSVVLLQAVVMLAVSAAVAGGGVPAGRLPATAGAVLLVALCFNLLYLCVATLFRNQQTFLLVMNIAATVVVFAAPAFYGYAAMPPVLRFVSWANPVSYGLDVVRSAASGRFGAQGAASLAVMCALGAAGCAATVRTLARRVARG